MHTRWRMLTVMATAGTLLSAGLMSGIASAATVPSVTISAASKFAPVGGDVYVAYRSGRFSRAMVSGQVTGAASGEVVTLYASRFPFRKAPAPVRGDSVTLTGTTGAYSFRLRPKLATRYEVMVFQDATGGTPLATSARQTVYVTAGGHVKSVDCGFPCHTYRVYEVVPSSARRTEMAKHVYPYFGYRFRIRRRIRWLYRNGAHARVSRARRVSASEFEVTIRFRIRVGSHHAYTYAWTSCTRDTVTTDGLGLPGHHHCGARRVRRNHGYLG